MGTILKSFRVLSDPTRIRLIALLKDHELSVNELKEILQMGQSRISTHLGLLLDSGLVQTRKQGKRSLYKMSPEAGESAHEIVQLAVDGARELPEFEDDCVNLQRILARRENKAREYFNQAAGRFGRIYGPGRSWRAFGHLLLRIVPPIDVADLGSGEGILCELLAPRCRKVIAVDNSEKIVRYGALQAKKKKLNNLEFRLGDLQDPPIEDASVDLVILSHALHHAENPERAIHSAYRILRKDGQVIILDLAKHDFELARELYGDCILGFAEGDLHRWLETAGFEEIEISTVAREAEAPHFETLLALGRKREMKTI